MPGWGEWLMITTIGSLSTVGAALYMLQNKMIYMPGVPEPRTVVRRPDEFGMEYEDVYIRASDETKLHGFLMLHGARTHTLPTVIMFQANAGSISHRLPLARAFHDRLSCNVFMLSCESAIRGPSTNLQIAGARRRSYALLSPRSYGLSEGAPSEAGIRLDSRAALKFIKDRAELKSTNVVLYGQSIGVAVALDLAATEGDDISGIIAENGFTGLRELIPHVLPPITPFLRLLREHWRSIDIIDQITAPILFLSGARDELVPPAHMRELFDKCGSKRKRFVSLPQGTHNDTCVQPEYWPAIRTFLAEELNRPADPDAKDVSAADLHDGDDDDDES